MSLATTWGARPADRAPTGSATWPFTECLPLEPLALLPWDPVYMESLWVQQRLMGRELFSSGPERGIPPPSSG